MIKWYRAKRVPKHIEKYQLFSCKEYYPGISVVNRETFKNRVIRSDNDWLEYVELGTEGFVK